MFIFETGQLNPRFIINFPTKRHWRGKSRLIDIKQGLTDLVVQVRRLEIKSIALLPLGCGLGGLDWRDVRPRIEAAFADLPNVHVIVYEPADAPPAEDMVRAGTVPNMTAGRAALIGLIRTYLDGLMDPAVTLLEIHKLMYFMQEAGQDLRLKFVKAPYGPYAENLRHVLARVEGYHLSGFRDGGDDPTKVIDLVPGAVEEASRFLAGDPDTRRRFDRVAKLVDGFETPFGLELLATVHWIATHENTDDQTEVRNHLARWGERKMQFTHEQVSLALAVLRENGWLQGVRVDA